MSHLDTIKDRFLRDQLPVRLGGLAANLRRITSFSRSETNREAVAALIDESKYFIEWTAAEAEIDTAGTLVELQVQLARWQRNWSGIWADPERRSKVGEESRVWSDRVLALSGLMNEQPPL
jgi:hypothetical protein